MANLQNALVDMDLPTLTNMLEADIRNARNFLAWVEDANSRYSVNINSPLMTALTLTAAQQAQISAFMAYIGNLQGYNTGTVPPTATNVRQLLTTILPTG